MFPDSYHCRGNAQNQHLITNYRAALRTGHPHSARWGNLSFSTGGSERRKRFTGCTLSSTSGRGAISAGLLLTLIARTCGSGIALSSRLETLGILQCGSLMCCSPIRLGLWPSRWAALWVGHLNHNTPHVQCHPFAFLMRLQWEHLRFRQGFLKSLWH